MRTPAAITRQLTPVLAAALAGHPIIVHHHEELAELIQSDPRIRRVQFDVVRP